MVSQINTLRIEFTHKEIQGVEYLSKLRYLLEAVQQHRGMSSAYLRGDTSFKSRIEQKQKEFSVLFEKIEIIEKKHSRALNTTSLWQTLKKNTNQTINESLSNSAKTSFAKHTEVIKEIIALDRHIGDTSNLILDPDIDTYYLMDVLLIRLPDLFEYLGQSRGLGSGICATGKITPEERFTLLRLYILIDVGFKEVDASLQRAFLDNTEIQQELGSIRKKVSIYLENYLNMLDRGVIKAEKPSVTATELFDTATVLLDQSFDFYDKVAPLLTRLLEKRKNHFLRILYFLLAVSLLIVLFAMLCGILIGHSIVSPIQKAIQFSNKISFGDLTEMVSVSSVGADEAGKLLTSMNVMGANISGIVSRLQLASKQMDVMSSQLAESTYKFVDSSREQAAASEETSASVEELSASFGTVADSIEQQTNNVEDINDRIQYVGKSMNDINSSMQILEKQARSYVTKGREGRQIVQQATEAMGEITKNSAHISKIVGIITDISKQTNLLALNASIEAARAGEVGQGFAVVSEEISRLADKTDKSVKEINNLIKGTTESVSNGSYRVKETETLLSSIILGVEQIEKSSTNVMDLIQNQLQNVSSIATSARELSDFSIEIKHATEEQKHATEEINQAVQDISEQTQAITNNAELLSGLIHKLNTFGSIMRDIIIIFKVSDHHFIQWNDSFRVNVKVIDEQHQRLFDLINELYANMQKSESRDIIAKTIKDLLDYTVYHFREEEKLMERSNYSGIEQHIKIHKSMIENIQRFQKEFESGNPLVHYEILSFVGNWLTAHIMGVDRKYMGHFTKHGIF